MQILLVDNDPLSQQVINRFLSSQGYEVTIASTGKDALSLARSRNFALVLIELHLPDQDSSDLLEFLRRQPTYANSPMIALSSLGEVQRRWAYEDGFDEYLAKPIDFDELLGTVRRHLGENLERALGA